MTKSKTTPYEQKAKLVKKLNSIESKIEALDEKRAKKMATLAKRFRLVDLSDHCLETAFKNLYEQYKADTLAFDNRKKNT